VKKISRVLVFGEGRMIIQIKEFSLVSLSSKAATWYTLVTIIRLKHDEEIKQL
jgi:hypothetical protein